MLKHDLRTRLVRLFLRPVLVAELVAACTFLCMSPVVMAGDWPTFHGDYALTGVSTSRFPAIPSRLWSARVGNDLPSPVVGAGGRIFCIADREVITALDGTGAQLWSSRVPVAGEGEEVGNEDFEAPPMLTSGGMLVVAATSGTAYGLSATDGARRWTYAAEERIQGTPGYAADRVFLMAQQSGSLHAVKASDGSKLWTGEPFDRCDAHISVSSDRVVFGNCTAAFHSFDIESGEPAESIEIGEGGEMAGGVAIVGGKAYGGNRSGAMIAVDLVAGSVLWSNTDSKGELFTTPAVKDGSVVFCGGDAIIYCLDTATGATRWTFDTGGREPKSPVIAGDGVIAVSDGTLYGLSLEDGALRWKREVSDEITSPSLIGGCIIVGVDDGRVVAYGYPVEPGKKE